MSWLYSRVLVEDSSVDISLDGEQCALWSGTHMPRASWLPAKTTDAYLLSRSGMMYKPLTDDLGAAVRNGAEDYLASFFFPLPFFFAFPSPG